MKSYTSTGAEWITHGPWIELREQTGSSRNCPPKEFLFCSTDASEFEIILNTSARVSHI